LLSLASGTVVTVQEVKQVCRQHGGVKVVPTLTAMALLGPSLDPLYTTSTFSSAGGVSTTFVAAGQLLQPHILGLLVCS
jgi:hypothetical protein